MKVPSGRACCRAVAVFVALCLWSSLSADSRTFLRAQDEPGAAAETPASDQPVARKSDVVRQRQAALQGVIMLAAIIGGGTLLLLLVVLWGNRLRRRARKPLPCVAPRDELWFLKKNLPDDIPGQDDSSAPGTHPD